MKKESINTFNEGLNFDLNPITTPNNVLTDCVNGSFITFNGDELALQNDAGNTKINIASTKNITVPVYGALYNYWVANKNGGSGVGSIAPLGWHVPSFAEIQTLLTYIGGDSTAGGKLKMQGTELWSDPNVGATNEFGFNAIGSGLRNLTGDFINHNSQMNLICIYSNPDFAGKFSIFSYEEQVYLSNYWKVVGYSIRLVKDDSIWTSGDTLTDVDGHVYSTVKIGDQIWTTGNLAVSSFNDGSSIPNVTDAATWATLTSEGFCWYNNIVENGYKTITVPAIDSVKLTEGFYPLGIKEYGGILYIVSGKLPDQPALAFNTETTYIVGEFMYFTRLGVDYYFQCLVGGQYEELDIPLGTNENWHYIGLKNDFINKYGHIEFGSYPSIDVADPLDFDTSLDYNVENIITTSPSIFKNILYTPQVINNSNFQAGVYAKFKTLSALVTTNIGYHRFNYNETTETITNQTKVKYIYKVRLLHQLTNGFIDLTDDVWEKYAIYIYNTSGVELNKSIVEGIRYWFNDPDFKYYCPHNFKGKLVLSVELEPFDLFRLNYVESSSDATYYNLNFSTSITNTTSWNDDEIYQYFIFYTLDGTKPNLNSSFQLASNPNILSIPIVSNENKTVNYKIIPQFRFNGNPLLLSDFPQAFLDFHTISGSQLLVTETQDLKVIIDSGSSVCEVGYTGYKISNFLNLVNSKGENIDNELQPAYGIKYQFVEESETVTAPNILLGNFSIGIDNKAILLIPSLNPLYEMSSEVIAFVETYISNMIVKIADASCSSNILGVIVNRDFGVTYPISVIQSGVSVDPIRIDATHYQFILQPAVAFTVKTNAGFGGILDTYDYTDNDGIISNTSIDYGIVTKISLDRKISATQVKDSYLTSIPLGFFNSVIQGFSYDCTITNPAFEGTFIDSVTIGSGLSDQFHQYHLNDYPVDPNGYPTYEIIFNGSPIGSFVNLPSNGSILLVNDHLLLKTLDLPII